MVRNRYAVAGLPSGLAHRSQVVSEPAKDPEPFFDFDLIDDHAAERAK